MLRIKEIRELRNLTQDDMAVKTGISKRSYVDYENGKADIQLSKLQNIATVLNVSLSDLLSETKSKKNVLEKNEDIYEDINEDNPNVKKMSPISTGEGHKGIPLIPIDAMAGFGTGSIQVMAYETGNYVIPEFSELNVDFMIRVKGSSMVPKYNSGDLVACKKLFINDIFFQWNKVYVLDTEQGALIKRVKKGVEDGFIKLISDNERYDPFELHLSKIYAVALVVGVIRLE